jgi:hypothetical protein
LFPSSEILLRRYCLVDVGGLNPDACQSPELD